MMNRKRLFTVGVALASYAASYTILSLLGEYEVTETGKLRLGIRGDPLPGFAIPDIEQWQPRWAYFQPFRTGDGKDRFRGNKLGYFFAPLILLDQKHIHATQHLPMNAGEID